MSTVRGWCPSAHRPMASGDGLLVRVRPPMARLTVTQGQALAGLSARFGNGLIDLTSRANLHVRGVREADHPALLGCLIDAGLVAEDPTRELPLTLTPFPDADGTTDKLVAALQASAQPLPELPDKIGIIIDTGQRRWLSDVSGDFRFERSDDGLILRADGVEKGRSVTLDTAADALIDMAHWILRSGGAAPGRLRRHVVKHDLPADWCVTAPVPSVSAPPGPDLRAGILGVAFGQITASDLGELCGLSDVSQVFVTPWRLLCVTDISGNPTDISVVGREDDIRSSFLTDRSDPLLRITACPGAPRCAQASVETRDFGRRLAELSSGAVHLSGCAKGCASQSVTPTTLVGRDGRFDLVENGRTTDTPKRTGLAPEDVLEHFANNRAENDHTTSNDVPAASSAEERQDRAKGGDAPSIDQADADEKAIAP